MEAIKFEDASLLKAADCIKIGSLANALSVGKLDAIYETNLKGTFWVMANQDSVPCPVDVVV